MQALIFRFFDICLLRAGPQDLPSSHFLLRVMVVLNLSLHILVYYPTKGFEQAFVEVLFDFILVVILLYAALQWRGLQARFRQSLTAIMGTGIILVMIAMPFVYRLMAAEASGETSLIALQFYLLILVWNITVIAHIIRHTFSIHLAYGFLVSIGYLVLLWTLSDYFFGTSG